MKKTIIIIAAIVIAIIVIIFALFAYSYSQIQVSFNEVSSISVELENLSLIDLINLGIDALSGNWIESAVGVIAGINLELVFGLSNNGLLPVFIPELSYELSLNGISIGTGSSELNTTINPGETKEIPILQIIQKDNLSPAIESIINTEGIVDIGVSGIAYFELWGNTIPIPFESTQQISIVEEIQKQLEKQI